MEEEVKKDEVTEEKQEEKEEKEKPLDKMTAPELREIAKEIPGVDGVHAMPDPTEGGLATALHEMADASGNGFIVESDSIHLFPETRVLSERFAIDPLGLIASGSLLITRHLKSASLMVSRLS